MGIMLPLLSQVSCCIWTHKLPNISDQLTNLWNHLNEHVSTSRLNEKYQMISRYDGRWRVPFQQRKRRYLLTLLAFATIDFGMASPFSDSCAEPSPTTVAPSGAAPSLWVLLFLLKSRKTWVRVGPFNFYIHDDILSIESTVPSFLQL